MARGKYSMQSRRLLTSTPKEIMSYTARELLDSIRMSEGRTVSAVAWNRAPNLFDGVSNAEICAAFGADIVMIPLYDPSNPYIPGLPSKESKEPDDSILGQFQIEMGRGWSLRELRELIGRPIAVLLIGTPRTKDAFKGEMETSYARTLASRELARSFVEAGADILALVDWVENPEGLSRLIAGIREEIQDRAAIEFLRPLGPGLLGQQGRRELITEEEIRAVVRAGADIIGIAAVGTYPGYTLDYVKTLVDIIHSEGALAELCIATSQEGSDVETIRQIALYDKMAGADIHAIYNGWTGELIPPPENIMALSIAVRGVRHTYRRMAISPLR